jgi:hypothetical protein
MKVNSDTHNHILTGDRALLDRLIEERYRLIEACKKALTCQASMDSSVVELVARTVRYCKED